MKDYLIAPSILSADFARLGEEVNNVIEAGGDIIHFDVMDNHFVPNLTIGPLVLQSLRKFGIKHTLDVHLMIKPVERLINSFIDAGANLISFHPEAAEDVSKSIQMIKNGGVKAGLVLNPDVSTNILNNYIDEIDFILLMSVNPGFGGQKFIESVYEKIKLCRQMIEKTGRDIRLEVDGGITLDNIRKIAEAGADMFVSGSTIFNSPNYGETITKMRNEISLANG